MADLTSHGHEQVSDPETRDTCTCHTQCLCIVESVKVLVLVDVFTRYTQKKMAKGSPKWLCAVLRKHFYTDLSLTQKLYLLAGSTTIVNRSTKLNSSSMACHVTDLKNIIDESGKPCVTLLMDNGPHQTIKSDKNVFALRRMFTSCGLDSLTAVHYAPGDSAQNPIEHQWSPRSRDLAGVYLSPCMPGEDKPPASQKLPKEEITEKEK